MPPLRPTGGGRGYPRTCHLRLGVLFSQLSAYFHSSLAELLSSLLLHDTSSRGYTQLGASFAPRLAALLS
jgi:hypothetical protein